MEIAIYARTARNTPDALAAQVSRCMETAGTPDAMVFTDMAPGYALEHRPGLQQLIQARPERVIVLSLSRLARDMADMDCILQTLQECGTEIYAVQERLRIKAAPIAIHMLMD